MHIILLEMSFLMHPYMKWVPERDF